MPKLHMNVFLGPFKDLLSNPCSVNYECNVDISGHVFTKLAVVEKLAKKLHNQNVSGMF